MHPTFDSAREGLCQTLAAARDTTFACIAAKDTMCLLVYLSMMMKRDCEAASEELGGKFACEVADETAEVTRVGNRRYVWSCLQEL